MNSSGWPEQPGDGGLVGEPLGLRQVQYPGPQVKANILPKRRKNYWRVRQKKLENDNLSIFALEAKEF